jgi:hypothetical protein
MPLAASPQTSEPDDAGVIAETKNATLRYWRNQERRSRFLSPVRRSMVKQERIRRGDRPSCHVDHYRSFFRRPGSRVLLWGPPKKLSWEKGTPSGYVNFAAKITDGKLEFKSGATPMEARLSGSSMTLRSVNPNPQKGQSKTATIKLGPAWRLSSHDSLAPKQEPSERRRTVSEPAEKPKPPGPKLAQEGDSRCSKMRDKLGCLCAVQNGGGISTDGRSWYSKRSTQTATNEAFVQCQLRAGRR